MEETVADVACNRRMKIKTKIGIYLLVIILLCSYLLNLAISDKGALFLIKESEHGMFYSPSKDTSTHEVIEELALQFDSNYERVTNIFMVTPSQKTKINIYTNREQFYKIIGRKTEGTYDARDNTIKVFTPISLSDPDIHSEYTFQLIHEFIHAVIQQINPKVGGVKWLDEGTAYFASLQLEAELKSKFMLLDIPTLEQLTSSTYFDDYGNTAYFYSGMFVKYIWDQYGIETLNEIIRSPDHFQQIIGTSKESLYLDWETSLQQ